MDRWVTIFIVVCIISRNHKSCIRPCTREGLPLPITIGDNLLNFSSWEEGLNGPHSLQRQNENCIHYSPLRVEGCPCRCVTPQQRMTSSSVRNWSDRDWQSWTGHRLPRHILVPHPPPLTSQHCHQCLRQWWKSLVHHSRHRPCRRPRCRTTWSTLSSGAPT